MVTIGPWLMSLLFAMTGLVELSIPWAIPIGFAFTLYLVAHAEPRVLDRNGPTFMRAYLLIWPAILVVGIAIGLVRGSRHDVAYYAPEREAAVLASDSWAARGLMPLSWVASGKDASTMGFFSPRPIDALPALPDHLPSYYPPRPDWKAEAGMIVCSLRTTGEVNIGCEENAERWAAANGMNFERAVFPVERSGLMFPHPIPFELRVVYVWPR